MSILKELIGSPDTEKEKRLERASRDFEFFCSYYLGHAFSVPFAEYQKIVLNMVCGRKVTHAHVKGLKRFIKADYHKYIRTTDNLRRLLDIEPREHGKTTRMSQALPLWLALTQKGVFPVIVAASKEKAMEFMDFIIMELENNERILEDFGDVRGRTWKKNRLSLKNRNAIACFGAGESIRGLKIGVRRPTHIICDDLLKDQDVESRTKRERLYRWFKRVVLNLSKNAFIVVVNTIMHPDDLPSRLLQEIEDGELEGWIGLRFSAIRPDGTPLWPQRWSLEDLEKKKLELGTQGYATEFDNEPSSEEDKKFKKEWFQFFTPVELRNQKLRVVMAVDPATGKATGDYSAIVVVGRAESGQLFVLDADAEKVSDMKLIWKIVRKYIAYRPEQILFETQVFQEIYKNQLVREALREGISLPVKGVKHTVNKELRISKLSPLVEAGVILFQESQKLLLTQLEDFPRSNDDLPDALEMAVSALTEKRKSAPGAYPLGVHRCTKTVLRSFKVNTMRV